MEKLDYKKAYPDLYLPKTEPKEILVPPILFLAADGTGAPEGESYREALQLLYTISFTIKMSNRAGCAPEGYVEYVVPPLEGLWDTNAAGRDTWRWTSLIRQPDFVTQEVFQQACHEANRKKGPLAIERLRLIQWEEGRCVQAMHIGPYTAEDGTLQLLHRYMEQNGLVSRIGEGNARHHEIYLGDPRRTPPERLRTVLRIPVRNINKSFPLPICHKSL